MNWQDIIKPAFSISETPPQYTHNPQNKGDGNHFGDIGDIGDRFLNSQVDSLPDLSPIRITPERWITDNADALMAAGFTDRDINGQGWFIGIKDLTLWQIESLEVELRGSELIFKYDNGNGTIQQKASPSRWRDIGKGQSIGGE